MLGFCFLSLSRLSYSSILGILSTTGSLWDPAETTMGFSSWSNLGIAFGLFIAGFGCHPLVPSLARDMIEPHKFERMINLAFVCVSLGTSAQNDIDDAQAIATAIYALLAVAGYLMFGNAVSGEVCSMRSSL